MLFCNTFVPLKMLLNILQRLNSFIRIVQKVRVMHLSLALAENLGDVFRSGNCVKLHYEVVSHLKNYEDELNCKMVRLKS